MHLLSLNPLTSFSLLGPVSLDGSLVNMRDLDLCRLQRSR